MQISYTLNSSNALRKIDALERELVDPTREPLRTAFVGAGVIYFEDMRARFASAAAGDGTWAPLAKSTLKRKKRNRGILIDKGTLQAQLTPGNSHNVIRVTSAGLQCAITLPVAKYHQQGTRRMPQRKVLDAPRPAAKARMVAKIHAAVRVVADQIQRQTYAKFGPVVSVN